MQKQEQTSTVPGVWSALASGFDLTTKHPWLLLLPILVDLFFWLGPRLRFQGIIDQIIVSLPEETGILELAGQLAEAGPQTNLFTVLSLPLIGVPAMLAGLAPERTPLSPKIHEISGVTEWLVLFAILSLVGLLLTAVYYGTVASVVGKRNRSGKDQSSGTWVASIGVNWLRLLGFALLFLLLAVIVYVPVSMVGAIFFLLNSTLGMLVLFVAPLIIIWITIYLSMTPQSITLNGQPLFRALRESVLLVQTNLLAVLSLLLIILLLSAIVDWLLIMVESGGWLTLVNILGHAFVHTALLTAFFIFYQDRSGLSAETRATRNGDHL